ncbi:MAG: glycine cleavage T C-terminal barrel domain-containing protein, partial [candidate division WOR-3 bacterium]
YNFLEINFMNKKLILSRTGYTGEDGFEIYGEKKFALDFLEEIIKKGAKFNLKPAGLGARDILRLEMGYSLYGNELTEDITPVEAGLEKFIKIEKDKFLGKEILLNQMQGNIEKKLIGLVSDEMKGVPRKGAEVFYKSEKAGFITSGAYSPFLDKNIALSYIKKEFLNFSEFDLLIRDKKIRFVKESLPFVKVTSIKR